MKILCVLGQHNYGTRARGDGYEFTNFIPALRSLGHEVIHFDNRDRALHNNYVDLNRNLLKIVDQEKPDMIFAVQNNFEIWLETWKLIQASGLVATVNWTTDDSWRYERFSRFLAPYFHAFTTTYPEVYRRYQKDGFTNVILTQWAANSAVLRSPLAADKCTYGVSFVGTAHGDRSQWITALAQKGIQVSCFGYGWPAGTVEAQAIPDIIQNSVISLNFANSQQVGVLPWQHSSKQIKARTFEVPGAGGFLLTEEVPYLGEYYQVGEEIATFNGIDDLVGQIEYYLKHPDQRDKIAQAGYARTKHDHIYDKRLADVIEFTQTQFTSYRNRHGIQRSNGIDFEQFDQIVKLHEQNIMTRTLWHVLAGSCSLIWGQQRGYRAARRFLYEMSWRFCGNRTYSVRGLPGRLFYNNN